jgi:predicted transcriptional regulator/DNA-binding XRE family transcriptional regulator
MAIQGRVFAARPSAAGDAKAHVGARLREIRKLAGITQAELATRLGTDQTAISRLESRKDILVSTLRGYIEALGATLRIDAAFDGQSLVVCAVEEAEIRFDYKNENQLLLPIIGEDTFPNRRDVVFSVKPEYSEKIIKGVKTVELRRRFPSRVPAGTVALIYATTPRQALTGIAQIERVINSSVTGLWKYFAREACVTREEFRSYFSGIENGVAIKLCRARALRRVLELDELRERFNFEPPQSFLYATPQLREALSYECSEIPNRH